MCSTRSVVRCMRRGRRSRSRSCSSDGSGRIEHSGEGRADELTYSVVMRALIDWLAAFLAGSAGWWLGSKIGFGTGVMMSVVTAGVGMYVGYRWFDAYLK